ncbi:MAG TPA: hypothetical protein PKE31_19195 [Pseudomonadota bacterium]|nr:hypothetical protein [Pseudomonadota bacterium]
MRIAVDEIFHKERRDFVLHFCCEQCGFYVRKKNECAHEWPTGEHRMARYETPTPDLIVCKEFELA